MKNHPLNLLSQHETSSKLVQWGRKWTELFAREGDLISSKMFLVESDSGKYFTYIINKLNVMQQHFCLLARDDLFINMQNV